MSIEVNESVRMGDSGRSPAEIEQIRQDLPRWTAECTARAASMSVALGADEDNYAADPLSAFAVWQDYLDSLPLDEFEHSDWVTLKTDVIAYLFAVLSQRFGCDWQVLTDETAPRGYRYLVGAREDLDGVRYVDLFSLIAHELDRGETQLLPFMSEALSQLGIPAILRVHTAPAVEGENPSGQFGQP
ncbi:hypothetical protein AB0I30_32740 [Nocardia tengchongensis]|uniref:hypothetical protein n=1 Tax=Nocardia tengchongensis TaxID=2055889 RepID=UPI00340444B7